MFTAPIRERLLQDDSVLRVSVDASLLVQSLLDLAVDRVLEIMDKYQDKIHQVEHDVLLKPGLDTLRSLHILSGDLIMHKRTLDPIKAMIHGLRHHDQDRCAVLAINRAQAASGASVKGYLSDETKLYLVS
ncbi:hypothetical protein C0991_004288 [Blastosporella zonata]|nr:hypothetical protein C0991_004288 [Blastosporella zonata]